jgi:hypothetical protein
MLSFLLRSNWLAPTSLITNVRQGNETQALHDWLSPERMATNQFLCWGRDLILKFYKELIALLHARFWAVASGSCGLRLVAFVRNHSQHKQPMLEREGIEGFEVSCQSNVSISPSPHVKESEWIFRNRRPFPELLEARQDTFLVSPVTPDDILHFHDRKPLRRALEQVR